MKIKAENESRSLEVTNNYYQLFIDDDKNYWIIKTLFTVRSKFSDV